LVGTINLRALTLKYLGWCPGVESAARFLPDREISRAGLILTGVASATILIAAGLLALSYARPLEWRLLTVTIDGVAYPDEGFNESFDYSTIRGKRVDFSMPLNTSEFVAIGGQEERRVYEFQSLSEAWLFLEAWSTPRVVIGFAGWISGGTHREAIIRYYGEDYTGPGMNDDNAIHEYFGRLLSPRECFSTVERSQYVYSMPPELNATEAIKVMKRYSNFEGNHSPVWRLSIRLNDAPPYYAEFVRYARR
jgi:hypothetical protein